MMDNGTVLLLGDSSSSTTTTGTLISGAVKAGTFDGIPKEITGVLPIVLGVVVTMIALRKGISFMLSTLRRS